MLEGRKKPGSPYEGIGRNFFEQARTRPATVLAVALASAAAIAFVLNGDSPPIEEPEHFEMATLEGETCGTARIVWESGTLGVLEVPRGCAGDLLLTGTFKGSARIVVEGETCGETHLIRDSETRAHLMVPKLCSVQLD